jgi:sec-independent protein translocase protein TatC
MNQASEMPFWDHIEELRWRIVKCILAVCMGAILTYVYSDAVLLTLIEPSKALPLLLNLQVLKVTSMFMVQLGLAIMGGIILGLPIIMYQTWAFISPAFQETHSLSVILVVAFSTIFFLVGLFFGYHILIPFSLEFFTSMTTTVIDVKYNFTLDGYLVYVMWLLFACGLIFQLPILSVMGTKIGILTPPFLRYYRKYAIVAFLIVGAVLTPPDPLSQLLIFIPLVFLYEFSIFISWLFTSKK